MTSAPSLPFPLPFFRRGKKRSTAPPAAQAVPVAWSATEVQPIEIVAPDKFSTALLLEYATPIFPAEVVSGSKWVVRLQPPPAQGRWVLELLSLVERWLESARLPSANVLYGGRSYVIRATGEVPASGSML
jgi:hypothetical protein